MRLAAAFLFIGSLVPSYGHPIFLTNTANQLFTFNYGVGCCAPDLSPVGITGLQSGENILGIDFRPLNGRLYALGSSNRLYTIDRTTAVATQVGVPFTPTVTLNGTSFGFGFHPVVDQIRVTSNAGQNFRLNPNDGTVAAIDAAINGGTTTLMGSAYDNFAVPNLYGIDANSDSLYRASDPNGGVYDLVFPLGIDVTNNLGFDIRSDGVFFGVFQTQTVKAGVGSFGIYTINLEGGTTLLHLFDAGQNITGMAILNPEPATFGLMGLGTAALLYFARRRSLKN